MHLKSFEHVQNIPTGHKNVPKCLLLKESLMSGTVYHPQSAFLLFPYSRDH